MAKKTFDQTDTYRYGYPTDGEMYWADPSLGYPYCPASIKLPPARWRIFDTLKGGWQDYTGTDPVSDDGKIIKCEMDYGSGVDSNSIVTKASLAPKRIDAHGCQCGTWKSGGLHSDYCDKAGQWASGEAYSEL